MAGTHEERLARARVSLEGLSVGDAFGDRFFNMSPETVLMYLETLSMPSADPFWRYTDDTNMALSIYRILSDFEHIDQDKLAHSFALYYHSNRGYGAAMHRLLGQIGLGVSWKKSVTALFEGQGSYGNGAAMRVAPIGAYFADDLQKVVEQSRLSAEITHIHPEGIAGAIAIAVATAVAWDLGQKKLRPARKDFIDLLLPYIPSGMVSEKVRHARDLASSSSIMLAISALGNGSQISAQDTVPFVLWAVGEYLDNYHEALWQTASALGDVDTTCAMVGGIVAMYTGIDGIPVEWIARREPLPNWALGE